MNDERLFDPDRAHARTSDPETSHAAAASVTDLTGKQEAVLQTLALTGPAGDEYLIAVYQNRAYMGVVPEQSESGIRTRRAELVRKGFVMDSGDKTETSTGRKSIVWKVQTQPKGT